MYTTLTQAFNLIREEEGGGDLGFETFNDSSLELMNRFSKYIKVIKTCEDHTVSGCFDYNQPYKKINGDYYWTFNIEDSEGTRPSAILADGTTLMFNIRNSGKTDGTGSYAQIYVDINGSKAPNKLGEDFFYFFLKKDRLVPAGSLSAISNCITGNGSSCTALAIYNENLDYLHCPDKFQNENATSCKD